MALRDDLDAYVKKTIAEAWLTTDGQQVPDAEDIALSNSAVKLDGTVLYADLAESTAMVTGYKNWFAAEVYKNYLYCAARIIRTFNGVITAYDGDRIMAVYLGDSKNSNATKTALKIKDACQNIIQPAIEAKYKDTKFVLRQKVGVDTSALFVARTGIRGSNDLVWVGRAANYAAKMAALDEGYDSYISANVYSRLSDETKLSKGKNMWTNLGTVAVGIQIYGSNYSWGI